MLHYRCCYNVIVDYALQVNAELVFFGQTSLEMLSMWSVEASLATWIMPNIAYVYLRYVSSRLVGYRIFRVSLAITSSILRNPSKAAFSEFLSF